MAQGMQAGSYDVRNYLGKLSEVREEHDAEKDKRRLDMELKKVAAQNAGNLDVQKTANEGSTNVATINNTGAMDRTIESNKGTLAVQNASDAAQAGVRQAQAGYYGKHGNFLDVQGKVMQDEAPFKNDLMKKQAGLLGAQTENQGITNTLARKYGDQRMQAEIEAQKLGVAKIGMEYDMLGQAFDKTNADNAMQYAQNHYNLPVNVNERAAAGIADERNFLANMDPKDMSTEQSSQLLGHDMSPIGRLLNATPILGSIYRRQRAVDAQQRYKSGIARPS